MLQVLIDWGINPFQPCLEVFITRLGGVALLMVLLLGCRGGPLALSATAGIPKSNGMAIAQVLIIGLALVGISQDFIGSINPGHLFMAVLQGGVMIRVKPLDQSAIGLLDLDLGGLRLNFQGVVVIGICHSPILSRSSDRHSPPVAANSLILRSIPWQGREKPELMIFLFLTSLLAFYLAWNLGANDVANAMGTSVGSKAITLRQALVIAAVLEFAGAVLFGRAVTTTLATAVVDPDLFLLPPAVYAQGMVAVLLSSGYGCRLPPGGAGRLPLPMPRWERSPDLVPWFWGVQGVNWAAVGLISCSWLLTPVISGAIAALLYSQVQRWILEAANPIQQLYEWIPWLSAMLWGIFGLIVLPTLLDPVQGWLEQHLAWKLPAHDLEMGLGAIAAIGLTVTSWNQVKRRTANLEADLQPQQLVEQQLAKFQVISACFVAFAHGSNDVGNAVAPLAAIATLETSGMSLSPNFQVPLWVMVLGATGIVAGLAVWGKKVITTVGEGIILLQPSRGFSAELAAATTILVASRLGLPVSTTHALVGGVIGIGLVQGGAEVRWETVAQIALAWLLTIPLAMGLGAGLFAILHPLLPWSMS